MHRPLREPLYLRVWHLVRGLLFYNTVYWRRASDGLNLPTLSPEERERQRPARNLEIIKPRSRPRAHIEAARGAEISDPQHLAAPEGSEEISQEREVATDRGSAHSVSRLEEGAEDEDGTARVYVKRRRYRRRLVSGGSAIDRGSFFARVFRKK